VLADLARDHAHDGVGVVGGEHLESLRRDVLVPRWVPLIRRRQVHPELDAVEQAAGRHEVLGRHLRVHDAGARRHPLRRAIGDDAAAAVRVAVADLAVEHVRDGLEPAMRVVGRALGLARRVLDGAHVVEEQERVGQPEVEGGRRATDLKALPLEERRCVEHALYRTADRVLGRRNPRERGWVRRSDRRHVGLPLVRVVRSNSASGRAIPASRARAPSLRPGRGRSRRRAR